MLSIKKPFVGNLLKMPVYTKNSNGSLQPRRSIETALRAGARDKTIERIIIVTDSGEEYHLVKKMVGHMWRDEVESKFETMSPEYVNAALSDLFWVEQIIESQELNRLISLRNTGFITKEAFYLEYALACNVDIYTPEEVLGEFSLVEKED